MTVEEDEPGAVAPGVRAAVPGAPESVVASRGGRRGWLVGVVVAALAAAVVVGVAVYPRGEDEPDATAAAGESPSPFRSVTTDGPRPALPAAMIGYRDMCRRSGEGFTGAAAHTAQGRHPLVLFGIGLGEEIPGDGEVHAGSGLADVQLVGCLQIDDGPHGGDPAADQCDYAGGLKVPLLWRYYVLTAFEASTGKFAGLTGFRGERYRCPPYVREPGPSDGPLVLHTSFEPDQLGAAVEHFTG